MRASAQTLGSLVAILGLLATTATSVRADLPPLPLQDCAANGLLPNASTDCEGAIVTHDFGPADAPHLTPALAISTRSVDFRLDADRPAGSQTITFTYTSPLTATKALSGGGQYKVAAQLAWPDKIVEFNGAHVNCRQDTEVLWSSGCDGAVNGVGQNPDHAVLVRQGACDFTAPSCTYRVTWGPYDRRVRRPMVFRVLFEWNIVYGAQDGQGNPSPVCGADPVSDPGHACLLSEGATAVTFATTPPPPLHAIGSARRTGAKSFEFDATASYPMVDAIDWSVQFPVVGQNTNQIVHANTAIFDFDFGAQPGIPALFFQTGPSAKLQVTDHWNRTEFAFVDYSFLEPAGTEGPLKITSFVLVGVDQTGKATLMAEVKNTTANPVEGVYLIPTAAAGQIAPDSTPQSVTLAGNATTTFTVTLDLGDLTDVTVDAKAFGTANGSSVKSGPKSVQFRSDGTVVGSTNVSQASQPGDTELQVASNDNFHVGDYVVVNVDGDNVEARRVAGLGSLIFDAPLSKAHAAGEPVQAFVNTFDTTGPTIDVTAPGEGQVVCQGSPLQASFTCSDAPAGVETCGAPLANGQTLDTSTTGARQTTLRAWDLLGNVTEKIVHWNVGAPSAGGCTTVTTTTIAGATTTTTLPAGSCDGRSGYDGVHCLCSAGLDATACTSDRVPAAIGKLFARGCSLIAKAETASTPKQRKKAARGALGAFTKGLTRATKAAKGKHALSAPCGAALSGVIGDVKQRSAGIVGGL